MDRSAVRAQGQYAPARARRHLAFQFREYYTNKDNLSVKARLGLSIMGDLATTRVIGGEYTTEELAAYSKKLATDTLIKRTQRRLAVANRPYFRVCNGKLLPRPGRQESL